LPELVLRLHEWNSIEPGSGSLTTGVFLPRDRVTSELLDALRRLGALEVDELRAGLAVRTTSFVGRARIGDIVVVIEPKIRKLSLMKLLRYAYGLRNLRLLNDTRTSVEKDSFQDLLIRQLLAEARELIARGLHQQYVRQSANLAVPRGRLDFQAIARRPTPDACMPCRFHPRVEDCEINRVLLFGLRLGSRLTSDPNLRSDLHSSTRLLDQEVADCHVDLAMIARARKEVTRLTIAYEPLLAIVEILLESMGSSLTATQTSASSPGFLFDMNRFFQRLLARFLADNLPDHQVVEEKSIDGMMAYSPSHNPRCRRAPSPRPDFWVRSRAGRTYILDAKYRDLWMQNLPREMLYQLSIYALSQREFGRATILYPTLDDSARDAVVRIRDPLFAGLRAEVVLRPVKLERLADLVSASPTPQSQSRTRAEAVNWLASP
jgi:5-methylcytosine-specific restriction enzyme subunit McrC